MIARLAPSPTGYLHLGNARSFLLAWLQARAAGGTIILRIEDIDRDRAVPGADAEIVRDLSWLGLDWDNTLGPEYYQSRRLHLYREALLRLQGQGRIYPCYCSRKELREAMSAPHGTGNRYAGTCRDLTEKEREERRGRKDPALRFRTEPGEVVEFDDLVAGHVRAEPYRDSGDFIVARADGVPGYQLAVVADDIAMGVTHVLRGDDLLDSTPRQILLYRAFGLTPPVYTHVPLILGPDGARLAKRHGSVSIREIRERGTAPEAVIGRLAWSCGLRPAPEPATATELIGDFSLAKIAREATVLTAFPDDITGTDSPSATQSGTQSKTES